jgi:hypothetical protein
MFDENKIAQRARTRHFGHGGSQTGAKERVETERFFESVEEEIAWKQTEANIKLRDRLVWFCITSFAVELFFVFLHSASMIILPSEVIIAVSALMGGSGFGLGSLLYFIARDLFRNR